MTGYRAFSYQFVKTYPVLSRGFEIETEMTIHALHRNMQVENVIIDYRDRPAGSESKLNTYSDGFRVLRTIARLYKNYRPFGFFSTLAAVLGIISLCFLAPVLGEYFATGLVPRFPTLIVCACVLVAALLLFISGVILSSQLTKDDRDFEFHLQQRANVVLPAPLFPTTPTILPLGISSRSIRNAKCLSYAKRKSDNMIFCSFSNAEL